MFKKRLFLPLLVVLALALTACTTDDGGTDPDTDTTAPVEDQEQTTEDDTGEVDKTPNVDVDVDVPGVEDYEDVKLQAIEVFNKYMAEYPDTMISKIELDKDLRSYIYKVEGYDDDKEYELNMNPKDGEITKKQDEEEILDTDDKDEEKEITEEHVRKIEALIENALEEAEEDSNVKSWSLEMDDGKAILEIELDKDGLGDIEYKYDVETEKLLEKDN